MGQNMLPGFPFGYPPNLGAPPIGSFNNNVGAFYNGDAQNPSTTAAPIQNSDKNDSQRQVMNATPGSQKRSQKQMKFKKFKRGKRVGEIQSIKRDEQRLEDKSQLKRSQSMSILNN